MEIAGYFASVIIGISLGLIGSGGSILTVPILVYLFRINPEQATGYSLFIVGISAFFGVFKHYKLGNLQTRPALFFAIPSVLALLFVRKMILPAIPAYLFAIHNVRVSKSMLIMVVFALLMVASSAYMIRKSNHAPSGQPVNFLQLSFIGLLVGFLTGFLGAGGGFLIIPALMFMAGLTMKQAVGTSLLVILINSLAGFGGDLLNGLAIDTKFLASVAAIAIAGMYIGTALSKKIESIKLKPAFGWFILVMGMYIIIKETAGWHMFFEM